MSGQAITTFLRGPLLRPTLIVLFSLLLIYASKSQIVGRTGWDPDDQLRLVQLRDFLGGQSWFDTTQYRLNMPDGAPMHWSRLIELPLALLTGLFSPFIGVARAEMLAGTAIPLTCLGAIALMASEIAKKFGGRVAEIAAIFLVFLAPAILIQTRPMRIDHHGWQAVMAMLALWTLFWGDRKWGGIMLGLALATWLHISLEGAPVSAAFFLYLSWRWIVERGEGVRLLWTLSAFAFVSLALFFGTQSAGLNAANFCDTVSPMHITAIALGSSILIPAIYVKPQLSRWRVIATLSAGLLIVATVLLSSPLCARGAFAGLDPLVREYWYVNVSEGLPIWRQDSEAAWSLLASALVGLVALAVLSKKYQNAQFATLAFFVVYATLLSLFVFRTVTVAAAFAAIPVAIWTGQLVTLWRTSNIAMQRIGLVALILALAIPSAIIAPVVRAIAAKPANAIAEKGDAKSEKCESVASVRKLSLLPDSSIIAPFDMGPAILMTTRHRVLASSHHRNEAGMRDQIKIFRSAPGTARALMAQRGITRIAVCPDEAEMGLYAKKDPKGLWAALAKAQLPDWLENEGVYGDGIMVWRVRDAQNRAQNSSDARPHLQK